ncbi:MAG: RNA polymerase factor sigma-54 [Planctomycetaceae bacterium]|nr:RNA polymerase factor sigma-54 [Planctomycetaceae bacterium]
MRLSFGQELRLVQKQVLAPRMIQSMEILQLPILALEERIEQEMNENPCLEREDEDPDLPEETAEAESPDSPTTEERELVVDETKNNEDDFERLLQMDAEFPEHFDDRPRPSANRVEEEGDRKHDAMANMISRPPSLHEYLRDQLAWFELDPALRQMCERIIYSLDSNGRLETRLEDLLGPHPAPADLELAEKALAVVQKLDPPGVGARDLRECLLLQLQPGMPYYEQLRTIISGHLEDLEHNRIPVIERRTGYSLEVIQATQEQLRKLNPKPGADFNSNHVPTVTPDVFLELGEDGKYRVRLEEGNTPRLFISPYHRQLLMNARDAETKEWIKRKINSAQWLIESIEQRRNTLTRVSQAIVDHQTQFLDLGPEHIEPLKMQQIADKVGVHVTTVSRAVDDKWIQTPRGIFPLKRFFGGGTTNASGEEVAWDAVRLKLQEIVDGESKENPYSDDELVKELAKHGLTVARRTVTKYRKAMNIRSSRERKDWAAVSAHGGAGQTRTKQPDAQPAAASAPVVATQATAHAPAAMAAAPDHLPAATLPAESVSSEAARFLPPESNADQPIDFPGELGDAPAESILPPAPQASPSAAAAGDPAQNGEPGAAPNSPVSMPRVVLPVAKSIFPE